MAPTVRATAATTPVAVPLILSDTVSTPLAASVEGADSRPWRLSAKYDSPLPAGCGPFSPYSRSRDVASSSHPSPTDTRTSGLLISGTNSVAVGGGIEAAVAGSPATFVVHGADTDGRPVLTVGWLSTVLVVGLQGPCAVSHKFESLSDGAVRVWYTPVVSGKYLLKVGVRRGGGGGSGGGAARVEPIVGSPFAVDVAPSQSPTPRARTPRTPRTPRSDGDSGGGGATGTRNGAVGGPSVRAADVTLRAPRGLLASAIAGQPSRLELVAPHLGSDRSVLPGRLKCVLHLQSAWFESAGDADSGGSGDVDDADGGGDADGDGMGGGWLDLTDGGNCAPATGTRRSAMKGSPSSRPSARTPSARTPSACAPPKGSERRGERYFPGRVAFAPYAMQPSGGGGGGGDSSSSRGGASGRGGGARCVFAPALSEASPVALSWGGDAASLGGTLLIASFCVPRAGTFLVHVTLDGEHVSGSPMVLRVAPTEACAERSDVVGSGLAVTEAVGRPHPSPPAVQLPSRRPTACRRTRLRLRAPPSPIPPRPHVLPAWRAVCVRPLFCAWWLMWCGGPICRFQGRHEALVVALRDRHGNARSHTDAPEAGELSAAMHLLSAQHDDSAPILLSDAPPGGVGGGGVGGDGVGGGSGTHAASAAVSVSRRDDGTYALGYAVRRAGVWALSVALDGAPVRRHRGRGLALGAWLGTGGVAWHWGFHRHEGRGFGTGEGVSSTRRGAVTLALDVPPPQLC